MDRKRNYRTLQELTIKDNFLFGAVMSIEENCRRLLELVLEFPIKSVKVSKEKSLIYHPEYKGVRLDIYADDENQTHYNVEMQVAKKPELGKRSRYYHSQVDMELLQSGTEYEALPDAYVIFICDFDPFGKGKYRYTFRNRCEEVKEVELEDGCHTIFLSTKGKNEAEISDGLKKFLGFVKADLKESCLDFNDSYIKTLQNSIQEIKRSREMGEQYMIFEEMMRDERKEGKIEGKIEGKQEEVFEFLGEIGSVTEDIREKIETITDMEILHNLIRKASKADSIEQFLKDTETIFAEYVNAKED